MEHREPRFFFLLLSLPYPASSSASNERRLYRRVPHVKAARAYIYANAQIRSGFFFLNDSREWAPFDYTLPLRAVAISNGELSIFLWLSLTPRVSIREFLLRH